MDSHFRLLERLQLSNPFRLGLNLNPDVVETYMFSFVPNTIDILFLIIACVNAFKCIYCITCII